MRTEITLFIVRLGFIITAFCSVVMAASVVQGSVAVVPGITILVLSIGATYKLYGASVRVPQKATFRPKGTPKNVRVGACAAAKPATGVVIGNRWVA